LSRGRNLLVQLELSNEMGCPSSALLSIEFAGRTPVTATSTQTHIMERIIHMTLRFLKSIVCVAVLMIWLPKIGISQINMQQMPGYSPGPTSSAPTGRNLTDSPVNLGVSGLRAVPEGFAKLKLAPGFLLRLNVLDDPDFAGEFRVDEEGDITLPNLGVVHVAGETTSEARNQIKKSLMAGQILNDPQVILSVQEYTAPEVTITGEVTNPGKYPLLVPRKLVDVLALAGGPTLIAGNEVQITRGNAAAESIVVHYSRKSDPKEIETVTVHPGDTILVKRAGIVYVLGAVTRPGGYVMQEEGTLNVLQAISLANGTSTIASTKTIHILRRNEDGTGVDMAIAYKKISEGKQADVQLHATDVLYVPTSGVKSAVFNWQSLLAATASASIYAAAVVH
jgi:polysaccharide export outer membrane protein